MPRYTLNVNAEINQALAGNLCRCGTYHRIRDAIKDAAQVMKNGTPA